MPLISGSKKIECKEMKYFKTRADRKICGKYV